MSDPDHTTTAKAPTASASTSTKVPAASASNTSVASAAALNRGRKSRTELAADFFKRYTKLTTAIEEAETHVRKVLGKAATPLPEDLASAIVTDAVAKALTGVLTEKSIWDAVVSREKSRLDALTKLRDAAKA